MLLLLCLVAGPARATPYSGGILAPVAHPEIAKRTYNQFGPGSNGYVGYVYALPSDADGATFTLKKTSSPPGNPDVYFYVDDGGKIGSTCSPVSTSEDGYLLDSDTETGTICPGSQVAKWAVVVLFSGVNVSFSLTYVPAS